MKGGPSTQAQAGAALPRRPVAPMPAISAVPPSPPVSGRELTPLPLADEREAVSFGVAPWTKMTPETPNQSSSL
jgi:hypothetical protein